MDIFAITLIVAISLLLVLSLIKFYFIFTTKSDVHDLVESMKNIGKMEERLKSLEDKMIEKGII